MTKKRQKSLGLDRFIWLTSDDSRVRESHRKLNEHVYEWSKGAQGPEVESDVEGLVPGQDFNCRCTGELVVEDVEKMYEKFAS